MMKRYENQEFTSRYDPDAILSFSDMEFVKCKFLGGGFGYRHAPDFSQRTSASNIIIKDCEVRKFGIGPALLSDIHIENLRSDVVIVWGAVLRHVTIKGRFDKLMIHGITGHGDIEVGQPGMYRYRELCDSFYNTIDWALDISQAEFDDFCIRTHGVPAHLIRRDPESQVVVQRQKAIEGDWRKIGVSGLTQIFFKTLIDEIVPASVLVAPKRNKKDCKDILEDIRKLRDAGIADAD
jgi:hypothetical protein